MLAGLIIFCITTFVSANLPELTIKQGKLRGIIDKTWNGRTFHSFTAIPYAEPPIGELRFKPPVSGKPWKGTLDAAKSPPMCPQTDPFAGDFSPKGQEDCLYLNVYTPQLPKQDAKLLPVLFFIHGGGFTCGKSDFYGPKILLDQDVVLVTTNYRLGTLGFLSTGDLVVPGNNGLKDQSLAIRWAKENIAHFGGNPNLITIFGQSAGGASVSFQMLSPLSRDLINGVIAHSGTAIGGWSLGTEENHRNTKKLAELLDCPTNSSRAIVECLRKIDPLKIVEQDVTFYEWSYDPAIVFKPVVEPKHKGAFLSQHPVEIIRSGKAANVPYITGVTREDGAFKSAALYNDSELIKRLDKEFYKIAPQTLFYQEVESTVKDEISQRVRKFYFGDRRIDESTKKEVTDLYTDFWFLIPADSAIWLHYKFSKKPVYYFLFDYRGSASFAKVMGDPDHDYGVCHVDDLLYLLDMTFFPNYKPTKSDKKMTEKMVAMWVNFARTGDPTPNHDSRFPQQWRPVQSDNLEYYLIKSSSDMTMKKNLLQERNQFWESLRHGDPERIVDEL